VRERQLSKPRTHDDGRYLDGTAIRHSCQCRGTVLSIGVARQISDENVSHRPIIRYPPNDTSRNRVRVGIEVGIYEASQRLVSCTVLADAPKPGYTVPSTVTNRILTRKTTGFT
jgi:hypothetical protein